MCYDGICMIDNFNTLRRSKPREVVLCDTFVQCCKTLTILRNSFLKQIVHSIYISQPFKRFLSVLIECKV